MGVILSGAPAEVFPTRISCESGGCVVEGALHLRRGE